MARRPIFVPGTDTFPLVQEVMVDFQWYPGFAKTQARKSIASLHEEAAVKQEISPILEISSKSADSLGISLSAFNLMFHKNNQKLSVECAYQGSKIFVEGGPYVDLYSTSSRNAKTDERLRNSGEFVGYSFFGERFPHEPVTAFYDWLYLKALAENERLACNLLKFQGFSDIAFNPEKSLNCQARSAALFVYLFNNKQLEKVLTDKEYYISLITNQICLPLYEQLSVDFGY